MDSQESGPWGRNIGRRLSSGSQIGIVLYGESMMLGTVMGWLVALAAVVLLWRVRGIRAVKLLVVGLLIVALAIVVWNVTMAGNRTQ
jgi:hypothetical protein